MNKYTANFSLPLLMICFFCTFCNSSNSDSQEINILQDIPVEEKEPVKVVDQTPDGTKFNQPNSIQYNKYDNRVYVVDSRNHRIVVFDADLNFVREFGVYGQGPGEFDTPGGIAFTENGDYIISDLRNQRLQIFNKDFNFVSQFEVHQPMGNVYNVNTDSEGKIYINLPKNNYLITVMNKTFDELKKYGEIFIDNKSYLPIENKINFVINDYDNLYCVFLNQTFLRKYNKNGELINEIDISYLPMVKNRLKQLKERRNEQDKKNKNVYVDKGLTTCISIDNNYLYLQFRGDEEFPIYAFDKEELKPVKKIEFKNKGAKFLYFDFTSEKYFYAISRSKNTITKFTK